MAVVCGSTRALTFRSVVSGTRDGLPTSVTITCVFVSCVCRVVRTPAWLLRASASIMLVRGMFVLVTRLVLTLLLPRMTACFSRLVVALVWVWLCLTSPMPSLVCLLSVRVIVMLIPLLLTTIMCCMLRAGWLKTLSAWLMLGAVVMIQVRLFGTSRLLGLGVNSWAFW